MSRVHIGQKNGRIGAWVAPAGVDASAENGKFILNSDADMLVPYEVHTGTVVAFNEDPVVGWQFAETDIPFTNPLPYVPLVFVNIRYANGPRAYFPMSVYSYSGSGNDNDPAPFFFSGGFLVYPNKVTLDYAQAPNEDTYRYNLTVFRNRMLP